MPYICQALVKLLHCTLYTDVELLTQISKVTSHSTHSRNNRNLLLRKILLFLHQNSSSSWLTWSSFSSIKCGRGGSGDLPGIIDVPTPLQSLNGSPKIKDASFDLKIPAISPEHLAWHWLVKISCWSIEQTALNTLLHFFSHLLQLPEVSWVTGIPLQRAVQWSTVIFATQCGVYRVLPPGKGGDLKHPRHWGLDEGIPCTVYNIMTKVVTMSILLLKGCKFTDTLVAERWLVVPKFCYSFILS